MANQVVTYQAQLDRWFLETTDIGTLRNYKFLKQILKNINFHKIFNFKKNKLLIGEYLIKSEDKSKPQSLNVRPYKNFKGFLGIDILSARDFA